MPQSKHRRGGKPRPRQPARVIGGTSGQQHPSQASAIDRASTTSRNKRWLNRVQLAWILIGLGGIIFLQHLVSHMGFFTVFSGGTDDLLIGYPTAGLLGLAGFIMLGRGSSRSTASSKARR